MQARGIKRLTTRRAHGRKWGNELQRRMRPKDPVENDIKSSVIKCRENDDENVWKRDSEWGRHLFDRSINRSSLSPKENEWIGSSGRWDKYFSISPGADKTSETNTQSPPANVTNGGGGGGEGANNGPVLPAIQFTGPWWLGLTDSPRKHKQDWNCLGLRPTGPFLYIIHYLSVWPKENFCRNTVTVRNSLKEAEIRP